MVKNKTSSKTVTEQPGRLYRCDWPNGDISFVLANSPDDAIWELDEVGGADVEMLTEVDTFQAHFALARLAPDPDIDPRDASEWGFQFERFGEATTDDLDVDAAVRRKEQVERAESANGHAIADAAEAPKEWSHTIDSNKPLVLMNDIEFRRVWKEVEDGSNALLGPMLDEARTRSSDEVVRTFFLVLVLPDGEERFLYGSSEYGDNEGRANAAFYWHLCSSLDALVSGEKLERLLLKTRLEDLQTSRTVEPIADNEGHEWLDINNADRVKVAADQIESAKAHWAERIAHARRERKRGLVSIGVLSMPDGSRRLFCESAELGDNFGRGVVADNIRTTRRMGLLQKGEALARYMLEIELQPLRAQLKPDPFRSAHSSGTLSSTQE